VVVGLAAAAVTTAVAAAVHGAGVPLAVDGEMIPLAGCAQMTLLGAAIGRLLLAVLNRRSSAARCRFLEATAAPTALSKLRPSRGQATSPPRSRSSQCTWSPP
jgi:hypothetical protein